MFRDPTNSERRFLPVLFEDCHIPATIRRLAWIDWRNESDESWQKLLSHLQPGAEPLPELPRDQWNPFDPYTPALGSSFFGRKEELRRLQQAMETGHSLSVVGDWRIGKTSLLAAFAERARASGRVVRSLTGEGPEGASLPAFISEVTGLVTRRVSEGRDHTESLADASGYHNIPADDAADHLSDWAEANTTHGLRPVLIVDEVERLISTFEHRFFERLRGMMDRLTMVLCSRRELDTVYNDLARTSPFYNRLELIRVSLLESEAVEELLSQGERAQQPSAAPFLLRNVYSDISRGCHLLLVR